MTRARLDGFLFFIVGSVLFVSLGVALEYASASPLSDFKGLYYSARCLLQNSDPYNRGELLRVYQTYRGDRPSDPQIDRNVVALYVHLPALFIITAPFAMLAWGPASVLWMLLTAASFILAAYLMWDLAAEYEPVASGLLIGFFLLNSELLVEIGNAAGIAISLCVIAVWCFVRKRSMRVGVLCLALSLVITPHDAGPVWLYFLLAGGIYRKRVLQTLVLTIVLSLPGVLWAGHVAPHWLQELHTSTSTMSMHADISDPGPATVDASYHGALIIDLQSAISLLRDDPHIYNPATYLICVPLLLIWVVAALRKRPSQESAWLALAAIAALSMLPIYHRTHDTRLLLLTFPAFAMLWAGRGLTGWLALGLTGASASLIGIVPAQLLAIYSAHLRASTPGLAGQLLAIALTRPVPLILLAMGIFYLWVYVRRSFSLDASDGREGCEQGLREPVPHESGGSVSALLDGVSIE